MTPERRRDRILEIVRSSRTASVEALARDLAVSSETIRRDLARLDRLGRLRRVHGGAATRQTAHESDYDRRLQAQAAEKRRIAQAAVARFQDGDALFVDAGSTTKFFAEALGQCGGLTVITNGLDVARAVWADGGANRVVLLGGDYYGGVGECLGERTVADIRQFRPDVAVLTTGALDRDGMMDFDLREAAVARAMIETARKTVVLADHTKIGRRALAKVCDLDRLAEIVTDRTVPEDLAAAASDAGVHVLVAP